MDVSTLVGSETLTLGGTTTGTLSSANVGTRTIGSNASGINLGDGTNGGLAANYTLTGGSHQITITQRGVTANFTRAYDGTTVVSASDLTNFTGLQGSDDLTITGTGTGGPNVGNSQSVTLGTLAIGDGSTGLASNYNLSLGSLDINPAQVTLSGTRQYDSTALFTGQTDLFVSGGTIGSETLVVNGTVTLNSGNVGTYGMADVSVPAITLGDGTNGGLASNYTLGVPTFTITQRVLSSTGSRQYDATTTAANADQTLSGLQGGETLTLGGSGTVASANVGTGKTITLGSLALSNGTGTASNYTLTGGTHTLDVTQRVLSSTGSRQYDATTTAANADQTLSGLQGGETLTLGGSGTVASANVGTGKTITLGSLSLSNGTGTASNYTLTGGTHTLDVTQRVLSSTGSRQYDATTTAANADQTLSGLQGGETLTLGGSGTVASANVGTGKTITLGSLALSNGTGTASNYTLTGGTHTLDVTQRVLSSTGSRQYDATTDAAASDITLSGLQGGETLTLGGTGSISSANVASNYAVTLGSLALSNGTGTASNYTLSGGTHLFTINQKVLSLNGSKTYDGNTNASSGDLSINSSTLIGSETLILGGNTTGTLSSSNAGTRTIGSNANGITLSNGLNGGLASNYTLTGGTHSIVINQKTLDLTGTRQYDASTDALSSDLTLSGLIGSETLNLSGTGSTLSPNVASNYAVSIGTLTLADNTGQASNYTLSGGTHSFNITKRILSFTGSRQYDATTDAAASDITLSGLQGGETLTLSGTGSFTSSNVGSGKTVTLNTLAISNGTGLASNYTLSGGTHQFTVNQRVLNISGSRQYDATTNASSSVLNLSGLQGGETINTTGTGTVASANVGTGKSITLGSLALSSGTGNSGNYTLSGGTHTLDVTNRVLSANGTRIYDGTTNASSSDITLSGLQGGKL